MNVIDVRNVVTRNVKAAISLEEAKSILFKVNCIIYEMSTREAILDLGEGPERIRGHG